MFKIIWAKVVFAKSPFFGDQVTIVADRFADNDCRRIVIKATVDLTNIN